MARRKRRHHRKHHRSSKGGMLKGSIRKTTALIGAAVLAGVGYYAGKRKA